MVFLNTQQKLLAGLALALMVWSVSFFLHFFWEMIQVPFFSGMAEVPHADVVWLCTRAAFGDANIAVVAYAGAAATARHGFWLAKDWPVRAVTAWLAVGLVITVVFEAWATGAGARWSYAPEMPRVPLVGTGALPLLQWLVIPTLSLFPLRWLFLGWCQRLR